MKRNLEGDDVNSWLDEVALLSVNEDDTEDAGDGDGDAD